MVGNPAKKKPSSEQQRITKTAKNGAGSAAPFLLFSAVDSEGVSMPLLF